MAIGRKTGGRKKGTPNKTTADLKSWISQLLDNNRDQIEADMAELSPAKRIEIFEKFAAYVVPKQSTQHIDMARLSDEDINRVIDKL